MVDPDHGARRVGVEVCHEVVQDRGEVPGAGADVEDARPGVEKGQEVLNRVRVLGRASGFSGSRREEGWVGPPCAALRWSHHGRYV